MKYQWLDLLRGVSALLVCANHLRAAMFVDHSALQESSLFVKLFYFLTGLGSQSVIVFFVLSGFFVGGSVIKRWERFNYAEYMLARLSRLWIVLIPALILTLVIDQVIASLAPGLFAGADFSTINSGPDGHYSSSFWTFLQNLFFLQTISAPVFGSNGPLWSLCNEFWYYVCFPLVFFVFDPKQGSRNRLFAISAVVLIGTVLLQDKVTGFLVWMFGAAVYYIPHTSRWLKGRTLLMLALPLLFAGLVLSKTSYLPTLLSLLVLGFSSGLLILALRDLPPMPRPLAWLTEWLARSSYSLYLVHFPIVIWVYAGWFRGKQEVPGLASYLVFVALLGALLLVAQGFWMLFEKHTDRIKDFLFSRVQKHRTLSPDA